MGVSCKANNYETKYVDGKIVAYNVLYKSKVSHLVISAIAEMILPDVRSFNIPLAVSIEAKDTDKVMIDKKLGVSGASKVNYFIPKSHYEKWKKSYLIINRLFIAIEIALFLLLTYIFIIPSGFNAIMGICAAIVLILITVLCAKLLKQQNLEKKYDVIDYKFD
ncbi:MAG: hypothetical protein GX660_28620 [Clostridiaceae bacterium]|nr:hypothetical protein [Clostridiaceae bacterium]